MLELSENQPLLDEVLRKIGRNVANFQKLEGMLKRLLVINYISGTAKNVRLQVDNRKKSLSKTTFGGLVSRFIDEVCRELTDIQIPDDIEEPIVSTQIVFAQDDQKREQLRSALELLVEERNTLVHVKLVDFDTDSEDACFEMIKFLDTQDKQLMPAYSLITGLLGACASMGHFLKDNSEAIARGKL